MQGLTGCRCCCQWCLPEDIGDWPSDYDYQRGPRQNVIIQISDMAGNDDCAGFDAVNGSYIFPLRYDNDTGCMALHYMPEGCDGVIVTCTDCVFGNGLILGDCCLWSIRAASPIGDLCGRENLCTVLAIGPILGEPGQYGVLFQVRELPSVNFSPAILTAGARFSALWPDGFPGCLNIIDPVELPILDVADELCAAGDASTGSVTFRLN